MQSILLEIPKIAAKIAALIVVIAGLTGGAYVGYNQLGGQQAEASASFFVLSDASQTATTTLNHMSAGNGTTTINFDSRAQGNQKALDSTSLLVQWVGSSTLSQLQVAIECSQDGIDYYQDCVGPRATTSVFRMNYASSTALGGRGDGGQPTESIGLNQIVNTRVFQIDTPLRHVRAVISTTIGSLDNSVWGQFIGKRQE